MDPLLEAEAKRAVWIRCLLVQIDFPTGSARWTDGGIAPFNPDGLETTPIFYSEHPVYGQLDDVKGLSSGASGQTTRPEILLLPRDATAAAALGSPAVQGSRVRVWKGSIDRQTGQLVGAPSLRFEGEIDRPKFSVGQSWALTLQCGTQAERQLEPNADWRLNQALQGSIWGAGNNGLLNVSNVVSATRNMDWRT